MSFADALTSVVKECGQFTGAEKDACMIRNGFQIIGPNQYSRETGLSREAVQAIAGFAVPAYAQVASTVGAVKTSITAPTKLENPAPVPVGSAPPSSFDSGAPAQAGVALAPNTLLILGGLAIAVLFAMRR